MLKEWAQVLAIVKMYERTSESARYRELIEEACITAEEVRPGREAVTMQCY
jgi:hypothetical protein